MGWDTRGGRGRYYTRSRREGGRVVREYHGGGELAEAAAALDARERERREEERRRDRAERREGAEADRGVLDFCRAVEAALRAALTAAGYHRHARGQWRKRRPQDRPGDDGGQWGMATSRGGAGKNTPQQGISEAARQELAIRTATVPETYAERHAVISRAANGDRAAETQAIAILRRHPGEFQIGLGNPRGAVLSLVAGTSSVVREIAGHEYDRKLQEIAGPDATPLERLLAERVVACRMQVTHWESDYAGALTRGLSLTQADFKQRRLDGAHRRLLAAVRALAQVRRLRLPAVQVNIGHSQNIAEKQVNIG